MVGNINIARLLNQRPVVGKIVNDNANMDMVLPGHLFSSFNDDMVNFHLEA